MQGPQPDATTRGLPRTARVRKKCEYDATFKRGRRFHSRGFTCVVAPAAAEGPRLGLAVSRRVGKAVVRNRVKRYVREFFRQHRSTFVRAGDLVVVAKPEAAAMSHAECDASLASALRAGQLLHG